MALYRFEAKIISRGAGRSLLASAAYRTGGKSATSAAAYRAGVQLVDDRTGETYDYSKKRGILGAEIMLPAGAPAWMADRGALWNAVEAAEKRKDAQTAKDYILSLPHELSAEQRYALTKWFVAEQFVSKGYAADIAWHSPDKGQGLNHHAHVMVTMRRVEGDGFARFKDRAPPGLHPAKAWKDDLLRLREAWADFANRSLEAAGLDIRISHESLQTRGIDREPEPKLGPVAMKIAEDGRDSRAGNDNREVKARNAERAQLTADYAAAAADETRIINLMAERLRRGPMDKHSGRQKPFDLDSAMRAQQDEQLKRQEDGYEHLRREEAQKLRRELIEEAERKAEDARKAKAAAEPDRTHDGGLNSAEARYQIALGENFNINDPYGSMSRAAGAEHAAFIRQQEALKQEAFKEQDTLKKQILENRRMIESADYMAITSERLAGISVAIAVNRDAPQAILDREKAAFWLQEGKAQRDLRTTFIEELRVREETRAREAATQKTKQPDQQPAPQSNAPPRPGDRQPGAPVPAPQPQTLPDMHHYLGTKPGQQPTQETAQQQPVQQSTQPTRGQASGPAQAPAAQRSQEQGQQPKAGSSQPAQGNSRPQQPAQKSGQSQQTSDEMAAYLSGDTRPKEASATVGEAKDTPGREQTDARQASARRSAGREVTDGERQRIANRHDHENQSLDQAAQNAKGQDRGRGR